MNRFAAVAVRAMATLAIATLASAPPAHAQGNGGARSGAAAPLVIGETFTIPSRALGEVRRINVYLPPAYTAEPGTRLPVLYMPDGGIAEDFLHVAGLLQVGIGNETLRPLLLVGIENTQRRRDLTGPSDDPRDLAIAPKVGGSAAFRAFLRDELFPEIARRYPVTSERAIVGESLAGLFVVETLFEEPALFDTYLAFDPSLWWRREALVRRAWPAFPSAKRLWLATSSEPELARLTKMFAVREAPAGLRVTYEPFPAETHATIYHPAALWALRRAFAPDTTRH